jgi:hypothetical protein
MATLYDRSAELEELRLVEERLMRERNEVRINARPRWRRARLPACVHRSASWYMYTVKVLMHCDACATRLVG